MHKNQKQVWYYGIRPRMRKCHTYGNARGYILDAIHHSITQHNVKKLYDLIDLFTIDVGMDPYIIVRSILILIESSDTSKISKNVMIYLEQLFNKLNTTKPEVFAEFLAYFVRNNRISDARELFAHRHKQMTYRRLRRFELVDTNLHCYEFLLNQIAWRQRLAQGEVKFDVSIQGWVVNAIDRLRNVCANYEYYIMLITQVLLHYNFSKKAYLFLSEFQRNNTDNISAQILLNNFLNHFAHGFPQEESNTIYCQDDALNANRSKEIEQLYNFSSDIIGERFDPHIFPVDYDKKTILSHLRKLDPRRDEIHELGKTYGYLVQNFRDIMDRLEYKSQMVRMEQWQLLRDIVNQIVSSNEDTVVNEVRRTWKERYQKWWPRIDFPSAVDEEEQQTFIRSLIAELHTNFDLLEEDESEMIVDEVEYECF